MPLSPSNLLVIPVAEPNLVHRDPEILNLSEDENDALARYKAIISTYVTQLVGLKGCHVRFYVSPSDEGAVEAVSFFILPILQELGEVVKKEGYFQFSPEKHAEPFTLEFTSKRSGNTGYTEFEKNAGASAFCLESGSRWLNMAFLQCSKDTAITSNHQLSILHKDAHNGTGTTTLPQLKVIRDDASWKVALLTPLGAKLKKFYDAMI